MAETSEAADRAFWRHLVRPELAGLEAYVPASHAGLRAKLDAKEAPAWCSDRVRELVREALARVPLERYPDPRALELKDALALRGAPAAGEILIGSGSDEIIALLSVALARTRARNPQAVILTPTPTFVMYRVTAQAHGLKHASVPLDRDWDLDLAAMARAVDLMAPSVIYVASPNNPTGNAMTRARMAALAAKAPGALVVIDEAYAEYQGSSVRDLRAASPNIAILRTVSKLGLAALRIGWLEGPEDLVREIDKARQPFNTSALSQAVVAAILRDGWTEVGAAVGAVVVERARISEALGRMRDVVVTPSSANFVWVRTGRPAEEVHAALLARGVLVRSFHAAQGRMANHLRITVGSPRENDALLEAMVEATGG